jgi:hypothetical protein
MPLASLCIATAKVNFTLHLGFMSKNAARLSPPLRLRHQTGNGSGGQ